MKKALVTIASLTRIRLPDVVRLPDASLPFIRDKSRLVVKPSINLENGYCLLFENGCRFLLEKEGIKAYAPNPKHSPVLCQENGSRILLEDGSDIQLEI